MEPIKINLATFEYQDKRLSYSLMLAIALIVIVVSILSIRSGINAHGVIRGYEAKLAKEEQHAVKRQQIDLEATRRLRDGQIESLKKDIDFINGLIVMDAYPYGRLLDSIELSAPRQGVLLSDLKISRDQDMVVLGGKAGSMDKITAFLNNLNNSGIYKNSNVMNLSLSGEDIGQKGATSMDSAITFEIGCAIDEDKLWGTP